MRPVQPLAVVLSLTSMLGALIASVVTLVWDGSFPALDQPGTFDRVLAEARGWSAITACVALPLGFLGLVAARRGSLTGRVWWAGTEAYLVYTYLEMAVSPPFSALYLVYVVTFATAIPAAFMAVASVDARRLAAALDDRGPRRTLATFALLFPLVLAGAWLRDIVTRTLAGQFGYPVGPAAVAHVVHALDLGLQVPLGLATGVMLLRREPTGWWVGGILLVQALDMSAALTAMVATSSVTSGGSVVVAAPFALLCAFCAALAAAFSRVTSTTASS